MYCAAVFISRHVKEMACLQNFSRKSDRKTPLRNLGVHAWILLKSTGPPRACPSPDEYFRLPPTSPARADKLKIFTLNPKYWLSVSKPLWLDLRRLICKSTNNYTTEKDRKICNIIWPRAPPDCRSPVIFPASSPHSTRGQWKSILKKRCKNRDWICLCEILGFRSGIFDPSVYWNMAPR